MFSLLCWYNPMISPSLDCSQIPRDIFMFLGKKKHMYSLHHVQLGLTVYQDETLMKHWNIDETIIIIPSTPHEKPLCFFLGRDAAHGALAMLAPGQIDLAATVQRYATAFTAGSFLSLALNMIFPQAKPRHRDIQRSLGDDYPAVSSNMAGKWTIDQWFSEL